MAFKVFAFGEILWDLLPESRKLGGAPFNFAYRVNSLGDVAYPISRLGRDPLGCEASELVRSFGIDGSWVQWDDSLPTGTVQVLFDAANNPDYFIVPSVAYDFIEATPELERAVGSSDCLCFGTLIQRSAVSRESLYRLLRNAGSSLTLLDVNLRKNCFTPDTVRQSLEYADIVKLNEQEAIAVAEMIGLPAFPLPDLSRELVRQCGSKAVVVTLAERGAFACSGDSDAVYVPGFRIAVVDTLGSGDAFSAGFVHRLLRGASLADACRFGNIMGALAATKRGGTATIPASETTPFHRNEMERIVDPRLSKYWRHDEQDFDGDMG